MAKLSHSHLIYLHSVADFEHMGGTTPLDYSEYRARESLRRRGLVKFEKRRRSKNWRYNFYTITERGRAALQEAGR